MYALRMVNGFGSGTCCSKLTTLSQQAKFIKRVYSQEGKEAVWKMTRAGRRRTLAETLTPTSVPAAEAAFGIGKGALAGGAVFGIGALCYYGLGLSNDVGAIETSRIWPQYVKDRISDTYMYFGSSILTTAASAAYIYRSPKLMNIMMKNSWMAFGATFAAMVGSGMLTRSLEYKPGLGAKQLSWMLHTAVCGAVIAPVCLMGGPIVTRAALYTFGVVGGLSTIAVCAPSDQFLYMGGPLAMGLGVVFMSSLGSMFLSPTTALGAGMMSISLYGGLLIFSGLILYDTQRIIREAETYPVYAPRPYDPVNMSIGIYLDTINIFIRIVMLLSGNNRKR